MQVYDNFSVKQLRSLMIRKGIQNYSLFKTKFEMIRALEEKDEITGEPINLITHPITVHPLDQSQYARLTVAELKEQMDERNITNISHYKTKRSMILALEQEDKKYPVTKVQLLVNKVKGG